MSGVGRAGSGVRDSRVSARRRVGAYEQRGTFLQESCLVRSAAQSLAPTTVPSAIRTPRARARDCSARGQAAAKTTHAGCSRQPLCTLHRTCTSQRQQSSRRIRRGASTSADISQRLAGLPRTAAVRGTASLDGLDGHSKLRNGSSVYQPNHCWGCARI